MTLRGSRTAEKSLSDQINTEENNSSDSGEGGGVCCRTPVSGWEAFPSLYFPGPCHPCVRAVGTWNLG